MTSWDVLALLLSVSAISMVLAFRYLELEKLSQRNNSIEQRLVRLDGIEEKLKHLDERISQLVIGVATTEQHHRDTVAAAMDAAKTTTADPQ